MSSTVPDDHLAVLAFLAARLSEPRGECRGRSSDALVTWALAGAEPPASEGPCDRGDLARCRRTVELAPPALAARMSLVVAKWAEGIR